MASGEQAQLVVLSTVSERQSATVVVLIPLRRLRYIAETPHSVTPARVGFRFGSSDGILVGTHPGHSVLLLVLQTSHQKWSLYL